MSGPNAASGAGAGAGAGGQSAVSLMSSMTTALGRTISCVLVACFTLYSLQPMKAGMVFPIVAAKTLPMTWQVVTSAFFESHLAALLVNVCLTLALTRVLEQVWGAMETMKYLAIVIATSGCATFVTLFFMYILTREIGYIYSPVSGFGGAVAGMLVGIKHAMPDAMVVPGGLLPSLKHMEVFKARWSASVFVAAALVACLVSGRMLQFPLVLYGAYAGWTYIRYFKMMPMELGGGKGDDSEEFGLETFVPDVGPLRKIVVGISLPFERAFCGGRGFKSGRNSGHAMHAAMHDRTAPTGKPLPGSTDVEAARRRERGAKALQDRLNASANPSARAKAESQENEPDTDQINDLAESRRDSDAIEEERVTQAEEGGVGDSAV